jgi:hypothetical protein
VVAIIGLVVAWIFIIGGLYLAFATPDFLGGIWIAFIGWFLSQAAGSRYQMALEDRRPCRWRPLTSLGVRPRNLSETAL